MWRHKISHGRIKFGYLPPENGFSFKKMRFYVQTRSSRPKIDPHVNFSNFQVEEIFSFSKFLGRLDEQPPQQQQPPWLINFANIWSEHVLRIKN